MGTLIITIILLALIIALMYRTSKAIQIDMYIAINHRKIHRAMPDVSEMIFSIKPLTNQYWTNICIKRYVESNQE